MESVNPFSIRLTAPLDLTSERNLLLRLHWQWLLLYFLERREPILLLGIGGLLEDMLTIVSEFLDALKDIIPR